MTELEQRLTNELGKLAEQYAREQQEHIQWSSFITELVKKLDASYKTLTDDLNELIR